MRGLAARAGAGAAAGASVVSSSVMSVSFPALAFFPHQAGVGGGKAHRPERIRAARKGPP